MEKRISSEIVTLNILLHFTTEEYVCIHRGRSADKDTGIEDKTHNKIFIKL